MYAVGRRNTWLAVSTRVGLLFELEFFSFVYVFAPPPPRLAIRATFSLGYSKARVRVMYVCERDRFC